MKNFLKNLVGVMVGLLFAVSASYAIKGGPDYNQDTTDMIGSYAGAFFPASGPKPSPGATEGPTATPTATATPDATPTPAKNSLGVFSINIPQTGLGTSGSFVLFSQGRIFNGTIQGEADPTRARLIGILQGSVTFAPSPSPSPGPGDPIPPATITENVRGTMKAHASQQEVTPFVSTGVQLRGRAQLDFDVGTTDPGNNEPIVKTQFYKVRGFKQNNPTATATPAARSQ